jgi:hypothetical protein
VRFGLKGRETAGKIKEWESTFKEEAIYLIIQNKNKK